jgi:hypothetical protein
MKISQENSIISVYGVGKIVVREGNSTKLPLSNIDIVKKIYCDFLAQSTTSQHE